MGLCGLYVWKLWEKDTLLVLTSVPRFDFCSWMAFAQFLSGFFEPFYLLVGKGDGKIAS